MQFAYLIIPGNVVLPEMIQTGLTLTIDFVLIADLYIFICGGLCSFLFFINLHAVNIFSSFMPMKKNKSGEQLLFCLVVW